MISTEGRWLVVLEMEGEEKNSEDENVIFFLSLFRGEEKIKFG